jgi:hypothetical protein
MARSFSLSVFCFDICILLGNPARTLTTITMPAEAGWSDFVQPCRDSLGFQSQALAREKLCPFNEMRIRLALSDRGVSCFDEKILPGHSARTLTSALSLRCPPRRAGRISSDLVGIAGGFNPRRWQGEKIPI